MIRRYGIEPEKATWHYLQELGWVYGTSADILRARQNPPRLDDSAAREWQKKGARLNVPAPKLEIYSKLK